jgi:hypothetical protein
LGAAGLAAASCGSRGEVASSATPVAVAAETSSRPAPLLAQIPPGAAELKWTPEHNDLVYTFGGAAAQTSHRPGHAHRELD